jgi:hypothetical protein
MEGIPTLESLAQEAPAQAAKGLPRRHRTSILIGMQSPTVETIEDVLETARQDQVPVALVLGRNGQTFDFAVEGVRIRMDVANVVLRIG